MTLSRRDLLRLGGAALAGASLAPSAAIAQAPKQGGTLFIRTWDPPHFDPFQTISYKTHITLSFTHSRLLKHKAGPSVVPGTFPIEGDLAESWMPRAVDGDLAGRRDLARRVRLQHARRRASRCARPTTAWKRETVKPGLDESRRAE